MVPSATASPPASAATASRPRLDPLQELLGTDVVRDFDNYGQGWAITQYLTLDPARSKQLRTYLQLLNAGRSNKQAAVQAFGDLAKLNAEVRGHVQRGSWVVRPVKVEIAEPVISSSRAMTPAEVALMPEMIAFRDDDLDDINKAGARERQTERRRALFERVRAKAARFPGDPFALSFLAENAAVIGDKALVDDSTRRCWRSTPATSGAGPPFLVAVRRCTLAARGAAQGAGAEARHMAVKGQQG
jgi:hypothetical protein